MIKLDLRKKEKQLEKKTKSWKNETTWKTI